MKLYKTIKYCKICTKKFFAQDNRGYIQYYCEDCFKKYKSPAPEAEEAAPEVTTVPEKEKKKSVKKSSEKA
jgi:hypothetical protein